MPNYIVVISIAIIGGMAAVIQAQFNGIMDKGMGTLESVFVTYAVGGVIISVIMLFLRGGNLAAFGTLPWYVILAGICGLIIIGALSFSVPRLGLVATITLLVATQFIFGALIDHYGLLGAEIRPLTLQKFAGIGVLMFGVWLIIR
jgi:transporter family-2 protein